MANLLDRHKQIPNGMFYYEPATKWRSRPWASFDQIVQELIAHRKANIGLAERLGWSTDYDTVANEVDAFNAKICEQMGWRQYVGGGGSAPPIPFRESPRHPSFVRLGAVAAGGQVLVDWIKDGHEAVDATLAEKRAEICTRCPLNKQGGLLDFFTDKVSEAIRRTLEDRKRMNLSTIHDAKLGVCDACYCPLKLKIHLPLNAILKRMPDNVRAALAPGCWIRSEPA